MQLFSEFREFCVQCLVVVFEQTQTKIMNDFTYVAQGSEQTFPVGLDNV